MRLFEEILLRDCQVVQFSNGGHLIALAIKEYDLAGKKKHLKYKILFLLFEVLFYNKLLKILINQDTIYIYNTIKLKQVHILKGTLFYYKVDFRKTPNHKKIRHYYIKGNFKLSFDK